MSDANGTNGTGTPTPAAPAAPTDPVAAAVAAMARADAPAPDVAPAAPEEQAPPVDGEQPEEPKEAAPAEPEPTESKTRLWARVSELDKQNRQLKHRVKELESAGSNGTDLRELVKRDPRAAIKELGISVDQVIDVLTAEAGQRPQQPAADELPAPVRSELETLKQELETLKQERQSEQQKRAMDAECKRFGDMASADAAKYDLINAYSDDGSLELCLQTARELYRMEGEVPAYERVLDLVEEHLEKVAEANFKRLSASEKLRRKLAATAPRERKTEPKEAAPSPSDGRRDTPAPRTLTEKERIQRAIQALDADIPSGRTSAGR